MDHNLSRFRSDSTIYHDEEEKQVYEEPIHTSEQSEPTLKPPPPPHNKPLPLSKPNPSQSPPPAAFSQNYTFAPPPQFYQPPLYAYSSKPAHASPKTHFPLNESDAKQAKDDVFNNLSAHHNGDEIHIKHESIPKPPKGSHYKTHSHPIPSGSGKQSDEIMQHPIARNLVIMGFDENHVERACKIFKKNFPSKPLRLEVLTEIIIRLQTKDAQNDYQHKSMELELNQHNYKVFSEYNHQQKKASLLKQSGTSLTAIDDKNVSGKHVQKQKQKHKHQQQRMNYINAINQNINAINYTQNSVKMDINHDINSLNINAMHAKANSDNDSDSDDEEEDSLVLVQLSIGSSLSSIRERGRCEIRIGSLRTLNDLKNQMIMMLNNDKDKDDYVFYHNECGLIFNDDAQTIKQCQLDIDNDNLNKSLSLRVGRLKVRHRIPVPPLHRPRSVVSPPQSPSPKQRLSSLHNHVVPPPPPPSISAFNILDSDHVHAHVSDRDRRQTKIAVMNNKIAVERDANVNFKEIISYIADSPFFWAQMSAGIDRVRKLTVRLKSIATLISQLCVLLSKFSVHCSKISSDVMKSWVDIENEFAGDMLSLNAQFFNLGETISTLSSSSCMLSMTLNTVIVDEFTAFCNYHLNTLLRSNKSLISQKNEYELCLSSMLHNSSSSSRSSASSVAKCEILRKNYELKRYDQCLLLNSIINKNRYDIILTLCAAFSGFETFFHIGYESSMSFKDVHDSIRMGIPDKISAQQLYIEGVAVKHRDILIAVLNQGRDYSDYKRHIQGRGREISKHVSLDYYDGYLWKQSSLSKKKWQKRWFVLTNGELEYFRIDLKGKRGKDLKEYIGNTALCKVKKIETHEYKYVFEIITPSQRIYVLQAQTRHEYDEWFYVLENQCARLLLRKNTICDADGDDECADDADEYNDSERMKREIYALPCSTQCADCECTSPSPSWCSINIGVTLCVNCCGVHRELGTHVTKIRSLQLDNLSQYNLQCIAACGGNHKLNERLFEYNLAAFPDDERVRSRSNFIKNKYMFKMYSKPVPSAESNQQVLWKAVQNNDAFGVVEALYYGADINYQFENENMKTVLHHAVNQNNPTIVQLLINNDAQIRIEDGNEQIPNECAIQLALNHAKDTTTVQKMLKNASNY